MGWFFAFFVLSGFCGLVYQVVWLRIAMAAFGVTTPMVSIVLSVFMGGLALGSWGAGRIVGRMHGRTPAALLRFYAAAELLIGVSGVAAAPLINLGREILASSGVGVSWDSSGYYLASGAWMGLALLPFCTAMGATFPLAMAGIRSAFADSRRSFSYLYVANVAGAILGTLGSAFVLIELLGFRKTMLIAASVNALIALGAFALSVRPNIPRQGASTSTEAAAPTAMQLPQPPSRLIPAFLFTSGLVSLALEVVWTRQFVAFYGPVVYSFATILAVYLGATVAGSSAYRWWANRSKTCSVDAVWPWAALIAFLTGLLGLAAADPRVPLQPGFLNGAFRIVLGIGPFCTVLGFLTPMLVDRYSAGDPHRAGTAYAVNTIGCIVGPVVAGFFLLPLYGERWTTISLCIPLLFFGVIIAGKSSACTAASTAIRLTAVVGAAVLLVIFTRDFETSFEQRIVLRDHTATVIATGQGMGKRLLVNGNGMTTLTAVTKVMAHLPLVLLGHTPEKGLVLCLGMGTSFRAMLSWGIPTTVVELVPSIPALLGYYHDDGDKIRSSASATVVVDDARRYLERTRELYDVIVVDPPPPVEAAASSLLYSTEFYSIARRRLKPGGILQQWLPYGEQIVLSAVEKALVDQFPYVRVFRSVEGWGFYFVASDRPIVSPGPNAIADKMPKSAAADLVEWGPERDPTAQLARLFRSEVPLTEFSKLVADPKPLTDDLPVNEYFFLRRFPRPSEAYYVH
jgi:spermidine synthase